MLLSNIDLMNERDVRIDKTGRSIGIFCRSLPASVGHTLIDGLKELSDLNGGVNVRLCLHSSPEAVFHSMIILENRGGYYRPHRHQDKGECFHIIEGELAVFAFDDQGNIIDACKLAPDANFIYRVEVNMVHAVLPLTDRVVYHESKLGPFLGDKDSIFPEWSCDGSDSETLHDYHQRLMSFLFKI